VPIVVAINKIDKPEAQPERVKRQLSDLGLMPAEWGGDTEFVEVSAKQKKGLDKLLEILLLVADLRELKANPDAPASGTVLESRVDKGRGPVATILVQNGTLQAGDFFICGAVFGKVRAMFDDHGRPAKNAPPSTPVEVLGLQGIPEAGDHFQVTDEAKARHIVDYRQGKQRDAAMARSSGARITLDQLHEQLKAGDVKELGIVIKADVQGSVEVLSEMLPKLSTEQAKLKIIGSGVGAVTENDVLLASASGAIIIAFGVRPDRKALDLAQQEHVDIRTHNIIYEVSDEIKKAMEGLLEPVIQETYLGRAEVRNTFRVKGAGTVAGCYVVDGVLKRDAQVRVVRDGTVVYTSKLSSHGIRVRRGHREFQRCEGWRRSRMLPGDETQRRGSRRTGQYCCGVSQIVYCQLFSGAAHDGRLAHPRAAHPGRAIPEGQAADRAQLERQAARAVQRRRFRAGISRHLAAVGGGRGDTFERRAARRGIVAEDTRRSGPHPRSGLDQSRRRDDVRGA
jgi:translation initiation factor IF-2